LESLTLLKRVVLGLIHLPETDPVERMKLVITFALSGLHNTCKQKKPFNPILGETYQAVFEDGTQIYCEQVCYIIIFFFFAVFRWFLCVRVC
jgi:hypothetical protein